MKLNQLRVGVDAIRQNSEELEKVRIKETAYIENYLWLSLEGMIQCRQDVKEIFERIPQVKILYLFFACMGQKPGLDGPCQREKDAVML